MSERDLAGTPIPQSELTETLDEHKACLRLVEAVEECLTHRPDLEGRWVATLLERLRPLRRGLQDHFESEEKGALFGALPLAKPRLARQLDALRKEHPVLSERLERIIAQAEGLEDPAVYDLRELNAAVQLFVATLRRHEAAENEIVVHSLWDELGTGD
ncbi:MAG TPA: hemerythrin domain-containing protein [Candidatus Polarisedimenticolaceae bacterium]